MDRKDGRGLRSQDSTGDVSKATLTLSCGAFPLTMVGGAVNPFCLSRSARLLFRISSSASTVVMSSSSAPSQPLPSFPLPLMFEAVLYAACHLSQCDL